MKKYIISLGIVLVIVGGYFALFNAKQPVATDTAVSTNSNESSGWIDVATSKVSAIDATGAEVKVFATGDEVSSGTTIKTDTTGEASVYFSDGSSLRIEPNTVVKISEGVYDESTGTLKVKVALVSGKVWSKITSLATPESHWEARTGTAVATVRGTAFTLEYTATGETNLVTLEHNVGVSPIDPETGEIIAGAEVEVKESESLNLKQEQIKLLKSLTKDEREARREAILKRKVLDAKAVEVLKARIELKKETKAETNTEVKTGAKSETRTETNNRPQTNTGSSSSTPKPKAVALKLINKSGKLNITEGTSIALEAVLEYSDGTKVAVTDKSTWQVIGSIGKMDRAGIFRAALGSDVSELGTAFGAITATYKTEDGTELIGKSEIITVVGAVDPLQDTRG